MNKNADILITLGVIAAIVLIIVGFVQNSYSDENTIRDAARDVNAIGNDKYCMSIENMTSTLQREVLAGSCA